MNILILILLIAEVYHFIIDSWTSFKLNLYFLHNIIIIIIIRFARNSVPTDTIDTIERRITAKSCRYQLCMSIGARFSPRQ